MAEWHSREMEIGTLAGVAAATGAAALWVLEEMRRAEHVPGLPMEGALRRAHFDAVMRGLLAVGEPLYWFSAIPGIQVRLVRALWSSHRVAYGPDEAQTGFVTVPGGRAWEPERGARPRVMFVHGGAWALGAPWQYLAASRALADGTGAAVFTPAYGLWPRSTIPSMALDMIRALRWMLGGAEAGGASVVLVGHSAGAHLLMMALLELSAVAAGVDESTACGTVGREEAAAMLARVGGLVALSCPFCPSQHLDFEASRGSLPLLGNVAEGSPMCPAAGGVGGLLAVSATRVLADPHFPATAVALLPPLVLFHGVEDSTVAPRMTVDFAAVARRRGASVSVRLVPGADHMSTSISLMRSDGDGGDPSRASMPPDRSATLGPTWDTTLHIPGAGHDLPPASDADLAAAILTDVRMCLSPRRTPKL